MNYLIIFLNLPDCCNDNKEICNKVEYKEDIINKLKNYNTDEIIYNYSRYIK